MYVIVYNRYRAFLSFSARARPVSYARVVIMACAPKTFYPNRKHLVTIPYDS